MTHTLKRLSTLVAILVATVALAPSARAQIDLPTPKPTPTPTQTSTPRPPPPPPPPVTDPDPDPAPTKTSSPKPRSTPKPSNRPPASGGSSGGSSSPSGRSSGGSGRPTSGAARPSNPAVARSVQAWVSRDKSPAHTTTRLLELIAEVNGTDSEQLTFAQKRPGFGRFPVVGYVWYQDDYGAPRYIPYFHPHQGTDLFAVDGTPVIAVADGVIWKLSAGPVSGNAIWLLGDDGVRYFYGHLKAFRGGLAVGRRVRTGDLIGYVGATGDAKGTYPHVHFEVNPGGRGAVSPKPILDRWLVEAETRQMQVLGIAVSEPAPVLLDGNWPSLFDLFDDPSDVAPALWTAGFDGSGATLAYADIALDRLLQEEDWSTVVPDPTMGASGELADTSIFAPASRLLDVLAGGADGE